MFNINNLYIENAIDSDTTRKIKTATGSVNCSASAAPAVGDILRATSASAASWQAAPGGVSNASNVGLAGVGLFKTLNVDVLEFNNIAPNSSKILVTSDIPNSDVNIDVNESAINVGNLTGTLNVDHGGTGKVSLTLNAILQGNGTGNVIDTLVAPVGAIVGTTDTQTLSNKSLVDNSTFIVDSVDPTIRIGFNAAGTAGTATTLTGSQTVNRVVTFPDATDTLVGKATTDVLTNKSLSDANCAIVDSADNTKQLLFNVGGTAGTSTTLNTLQTGNQILTLPDITDTVVTKTSSDILTNKFLSDTTVFVVDSVDNTIRIGFNAAGTAATATTITSSQTVNRVLTLPDATDTLVGKATSDVLTNKNLSDTTSFVVDSVDNTIRIGFNAAGTAGTTTTLTSSQTGNQILTLPNATDTLIGKATTDVLTNKSLSDTTSFIVDSVDPTIRIAFDAAGTAGTSTTITSSQTVNRILTLPNVTDTLVSKTTTDVLTNKSLSDTTSFVVDSADNTIRIGFNAAGTAGTTTTLTSSQTAGRVLTFPDATDTLVGKTTTDVLQNKSLVDTNCAFVDSVDNTKKILFDAGGTTGTTTTLTGAQTANRVLTLPNVTDTLVGKTTTDVLTNKSLSDTTSFVVDSADNTIRIGFDAAGTTGTSTTLTSSQTVNRVLTLPNATDTLMGKATTDTMTNKTLSSGAFTGTSTGTFTHSGVIASTNATASTSVATGAITTAGGIGCTGSIFAAGISLPTSGGTAALLARNEIGTFNVSFTVGITLTISVTFSFIGRSVILSFPDSVTAVGKAASVIQTAAGAVPSRFNPAVSMLFLLRVLDNGTASTGMFQLDTGGQITIYKDVAAGAFSGVGAQGFSGLPVSYVSAA